MEETKFNAKMTCKGCTGAVTRILTRMEGVEEVNASVQDQMIYVKHTDAATKEDMLEKLEKWAEAANKEVSLAD